MAAMARTSGTFNGKGAGGKAAEQNELHATHTHVWTHMYTHDHEGSAPYHVAMKHDIGPTEILAKRQSLRDPGGSRGARQTWPRTYRRDGDFWGAQLKPNGRGSRVFSQIKYLVYIMSWAHGDGIASISLETHNSFVPQAQSWNDRGHGTKGSPSSYGI